MKTSLQDFHNGSIKRKQIILTPDIIVDGLLNVWGNINCDPCAPIDNVDYNIPAKIKYTEKDDGLSQQWPTKTFINPPYNNLKQWLTHTNIEENAKLCYLIPVRTHRWFWIDLYNKADTCIALNHRFKFKGYSSAFPAPVCIMYVGNDYEDIIKEYKEIGAILK